jgi:HAE1 family hydrophobic/amphiphilic exporter-1
MNLIRFFVKNYVFSLSIFVAIVLFGLVSALGLGVDLLPDFDVPIVAVTTIYPGAGAEEVAEQVSKPVTDALNTLSGITDIQSTSGENFSIVVANFNQGADIDQAAVDVGQRLDAIANQLPEDAQTPTVFKADPNDSPILGVAVRSPGDDLLDVQRYAEDVLEPLLQRIDGVANVSLVGEVEREIQVLIDPREVEGFGITPDQIQNAISASTGTQPAGAITVGNERILLTSRNTPNTIEDLERILVDSARGLYLADLAVVRDTTAEASSYARLDGEPVVLLEVQKSSGSNSVSVAESVRAAIARLNPPDNYEISIINDDTEFIADSVADTFREIAIAVVAVSFVILLFIGKVGSTFSVVLAIPITLAGVFIVINLLGFTFNFMTLLAITVAVGLVVDDSIVIAENIERYRNLGYSPLEAVLKGAGEVSVAVLTATLSILAVFLPISFLPGTIGTFFAQFGLTLAAAITVSYLEALFFLTVRLAYLPNPSLPSWHVFAGSFGKLPSDIRGLFGGLRKPSRLVPYIILNAVLAFVAFRRVGLPGLAVIAVLPVAIIVLRYVLRIVLFFFGAITYSMHLAVDRGVNGLREVYARALRAVLSQSTMVIIVAILLVSSIVIVAPRIPFNFSPNSDAGQVSVSLELPPATSLDRTNEVTKLIEAEANLIPEVTRIQTTVGAQTGAGVPTTAEASLDLELVDLDARERSSFEVAEDLQARLRNDILAGIPEATVTVSSNSGGGPDGSDVTLTLTSNNLELLRERDAQALAILQASPFARDPSSTLEGAIGERVFEVDPTRLAGTGLTPSDIGRTLRTYNVGIEVADVRDNGNEIPVRLKADPIYLGDEQALISAPIYAPGLDQYLPLSSLGEFTIQSVPVTISRGPGGFVSTLETNLTRNAPGQQRVRAEFEEAIRAQGIVDDEVTLGRGIGPDLLGNLIQYGLIAVVVALLLNYLVIASEFNSFKYPLYLLLTVPLALVGAFWLFYVTGSSLNVISVLGFVSLIGLVTKNAILLLDVVMSQIEEGETFDLKEALVEAGRLRLRPILMTAGTIVIISIPLLIGLGSGAEFRRPLGLVIAGGVLSSTILTLFVVPAVFYRFERSNYPSPSTAVDTGSSEASPGRLQPSPAASD